MPHDSKAVASYFLNLAERDGKKLDPMKLQKLVYFAHGWYLAVHGEPLIDDIVEAWRFGPVIPTLYREFKEFGSDVITRKARHRFVSNRGFTTITPELDETVDLELLNKVWDTYGDATGVQLSNLTHAPGTPWEKAWTLNQGRKNANISDDLMKEYFTAQLDVAG